MKEKLTSQLNKMMEYADAFSEHTQVYKFIEQINNMVHTNGAISFSLDKYKSFSKEASDTEKAPFLSVILRTQGTREQGLREALLSLRSQSNQNFEVILIAHKASEEGKNLVKSLVEQQPEDFARKINYIELEIGTRTTPINVGCACARGQYISIFDDDDLLFDNWVESYEQAAKEHNGCILHAYVLGQKWKANKTGYMATEAPTSQYCVNFDLISQFVVNKCPLMGLAFPSYLYKELDFSFNEKLNVTEDWEFFMRVAPMTGVYDIEQPTSIYRFWENAESSYTLHSDKIWNETYLSIQNSFDERNFLIPSGYAKYLISLVHHVNDETRFNVGGFPKICGCLYYGNQNKADFSDERMIMCDSKKQLPEFTMTYRLPEKYDGTGIFRLDPCEYGGIILESLEIQITSESGKKKSYSLSDCTHNGFNCEQGVYFLHYDPQVLWKYEGEDKAEIIEVSGKVNMEIPENLIQSVIAQSTKETKKYFHKRRR